MSMNSTPAHAVVITPWNPSFEDVVTALLVRSFGDPSTRRHRAAIHLRWGQPRLVNASFMAFDRDLLPSYKGSRASGLSFEFISELDPLDNPHDATHAFLGSVESYEVRWIPSRDLSRDLSRGSEQRAVLMGPLVVDPSRRGFGVGRELVHHVLKTAPLIRPMVFCIGDPGYYVPLGFVPTQAGFLHMKGEIAPLMPLFYCANPASQNPEGSLSPLNEASSQTL